MNDDLDMTAAATMAVFGFFMVFIGIWLVSNFGTAMVACGALVLSFVILSMIRSN